MMNRYKKGELVLVNGIGKENEEKSINSIGIIKQKDYYFNNYYIKLFFGKDDWFKEKDITRIFDKKSKKQEKFKVGLSIEKRGLDYILKKMSEDSDKTIDLFKKADIFQKFIVKDKEYYISLWSDTYWPNNNYTVRAIEESLDELRKKNIAFKYIVIGLTNQEFIKIKEFTKNDENVDVLDISSRIKIKNFGGII